MTHNRSNVKEIKKRTMTHSLNFICVVVHQTDF